MLQIDAEFLHSTKNVKTYFEGMLIDPSVPFEVFEELFGIKDQSVIDTYKKKYFAEYDLPRFLLLAKLKSLPAGEAKDVKIKVFYYGWEYLGAVYNYGRGVDSNTLGDRILRSILSKLSFLANSDTVKPNDIKLLRDVLKAITEKAKVTPQENEKSEIEFILSDLREQNQRAQDAIKQLNERPADAGQTALVKKLEKEQEEARLIREKSSSLTK